MKLLLLFIGFGNIVDILAFIFILLLSLVFPILFFLLGMVLLLLLHLELGLDLFVLTVVQMVVVQMLHLLHVRGDLCAMVGLFLLHLCIEVLDLGFFLLDFSACVMVEIVDHVLLDLKHVTLDLGFL